MKKGFSIDFKNYLLPVVLFGTLIGLNEVWIGSMNFPYRSVVLNSVAVALLAFARFRVPKPGTSMLIIGIAILFKLNHLGFASCNTNVLLCGPAALLLISASFELFAFLFLKNSSVQWYRFALVCFLTAICGFALFGAMNTWLLESWKVSRLTVFIFDKGTMAGFISAIVSILFISIAGYARKRIEIHPILSQSFSGLVVAVLWMMGTFRIF